MADQMGGGGMMGEEGEGDMGDGDEYSEGEDNSDEYNSNPYYDDVGSSGEDMESGENGYYNEEENVEKSMSKLILTVE